MVLAVNVPAGLWVLNVLVAVVVLPSVPLAVTVTVYLVPVCSGHTVCQLVWPCRVPAAVACPAVTLTFSILPCATVTETPRLVFTFLLPFPGLIDTWAAEVDTVVVPPFDPCWPVAVPDGEEPEQAVASRHTAPTIPVAASPARRLLSRCRPVRVRSLSRTLVLLVVPNPKPRGHAHGYGLSSMRCGGPPAPKSLPLSPGAGERSTRSRSIASDRETDETGLRLPSTIMPTRRCGGRFWFNATRTARTQIAIAAHGTVSPMRSNRVKSEAGTRSSRTRATPRCAVPSQAICRPCASKAAVTPVSAACTTGRPV